MKKIAIGLVLAILAIPPAWAIIIHIPADQPTIQAGINAAVNGDTVLVASGTYYENLNPNGKGILLTSESGPKLTKIDGQGLGSVIQVISGEDSSTVIRGFTLTHGTGESPIGGPYDQKYGGGIRCWYGSSPIIEFNVIIDNHVASGGGGISVSGFTDSPIIRNNTIVQNTAGYGGSIHFGGTPSTCIVEKNIIAFNSPTISCPQSGSPSIGCNDIFDYAPDAYPCLVSGNNYSLDPIFCGDSISLNLLSPCWQDSVCGTLGALNVGCAGCGDINLDGNVSLSDAIFLINYIFNKPGDWTPCGGGE